MTGVEMIAAERERQIAKGFDAAHDDLHTNGQLAIMGAEAALHDTIASVEHVWDYDEWGICRKHDKEPIRLLVIGAALIAAEIDRLQRKGETSANPE